MTANERKLAAELLRMASDQFSNHGCNDFDLAERIPDVEARNALVRAYEESNGSPEEYREASGAHDWRIMDYELMDFLADKLEADV